MSTSSYLYCLEQPAYRQPISGKAALHVEQQIARVLAGEAPTFVMPNSCSLRSVPVYQRVLIEPKDGAKPLDTPEEEKLLREAQEWREGKRTLLILPPGYTLLVLPAVETWQGYKVPPQPQQQTFAEEVKSTSRKKG